MIQDGPAGDGPTKAGRCWRTSTTSPRAPTLHFATAIGGRAGFRPEHRQALPTRRGPNIIVDDVTYFDEPFFQDGLIAQAVNTVIGAGSDLLRRRRQQGRMTATCRPSARRPASITGIGSGTFMNFNPSGGTNVELPITTDGANARAHLRVSTSRSAPRSRRARPDVVTSNVNIYVLDAATGTWSSEPRPTNNNVATQEPLQDHHDSRTPAAISSRSRSSRARTRGTSSSSTTTTNVNADPSASSTAVAGGTFYPSVVRARDGREHDRRRRDALVGAGALPGAEPAGERAVQLVRPGALRLQSRRHAACGGPVTVQNPTVTAPDGGNTSFFPPGGIIDTSNPPFPGRAGDGDQPLAEPAQLLRHVVGGAQRRGRGRPDAAEGPAAHAGPDPVRA